MINFRECFSKYNEYLLFEENNEKEVILEYKFKNNYGLILNETEYGFLVNVGIFSEEPIPIGENYRYVVVKKYFFTYFWKNRDLELDENLQELEEIFEKTINR